MRNSFIYKHRSLILYAISLAILVIVLKVLEWKLLIVQHAFSIYAGVIAIGFTTLGIWIASQLYNRRETVVVEKEIVRYMPAGDGNKLNAEAVAQWQLSARETEVLECIAKGMSNAEIGEQLFLSVHTIKTHTSKLFSKLDVKSRTQAIEKARQAGILH